MVLLRPLSAKMKERNQTKATVATMEFACSHVVCNWTSDGAAWTDVRVVKNKSDRETVDGQSPPPPPPPPRRLKKPRPLSLPLPPLPSLQPPLCPPPVPPRAGRRDGEGSRANANVNVVSISVGTLVNISQGVETTRSPVHCGKCSAVWSCLSSMQQNLWACEFCGCVNGVDDAPRVSHRASARSDDVYLHDQSDDDYQNLEDTLVVFCVDVSGSMSVTTAVTSGSRFTAHVSRLEGIQDALQGVLSSLLQHSPRRRVALVTFSDEVVIYGDGTNAPLTLRDWALVDYDHIWEQGVAYSVPHCIAETYEQLLQSVKDLREQGATCLGPAVLASVAMASKYPGSKVIVCTDGRANIGLGEMEQTFSPSSSPLTTYFYKQLARQAVKNGVIISVMTFEGTDCRLADIGRLADTTGGRVNIVTIGTIASEIQLASVDNVLATGVTATLIACDGMYFPYEEENRHKLVREIGNVTKGLEMTFQFAVKPEFMEVFLQRNSVPFQLQLSFKTRDQQRVTRVITEQRPVTSSSEMWDSTFNLAVLGVHCAQLCASLTMDGRVQEAQRQIRAQRDLLQQISQNRPVQKQESIYGNWMDTMTTICYDIASESQTLSDEAAEVVYHMKRASSVNNNNKGLRERSL
nr:circularly permutated Ras protein 1 isoform X2 [Solea senegalensis]